MAHYIITRYTVSIAPGGMAQVKKTHVKVAHAEHEANEYVEQRQEEDEKAGDYMTWAGIDFPHYYIEEAID